MNPTAIYSKSGKGVQEASGKTSLLKRPDRAVLSAIDGRATLADVAQKIGRPYDPSFLALIGQLDKDGFIREVTAGAASAPLSSPPSRPAPPKPAAKSMDPASDLDFSSLGAAKPASPPSRPAAAPSAPKPPSPQQAQQAKAQQSALDKAREDAEAKAAADRERVKREAEEKAKAEIESKMRGEAEKRMKDEAEARAKAAAAAEAEAKIRAAREAAVRAAADAKAKAEAEANAKLEVERKAREEAERARRAAEEQARREAEELRQKLEAERRAREEAERKAREEAERLRREAEEHARKVREEAERKAKEQEEKAREQAERMRRELEAERQRLEEERRKEEEERAARRRQRDEEERREEEERAARRKQRDEEEREHAAQSARRAEKPAEAPPPPEAPKAPAKAGSFADSLLADLDSFTNKDEEEQNARLASERKARAEAEQRRRDEAERAEREAAEREAEGRRKEDEEARRREDEKRRAREEEERIAREEERRKREAEEIQRKAEAATAAAMAKQADAGDIPINDEDLDLDEVKQERQALGIDEKKEKQKAKEAEREAKRKRRAEEKKQREAEKRAAKTAAPLGPRARRPTSSWGRPVAFFLLVILLAAVGAAHVVPLDVTPYEKAATEALGQPVRIGSGRLWLFTGVQVRLDGVRVGDARVGRVVTHPALGSVFGEQKHFSLIELERVALPQAAFGEALFARVKSERFSVERVVARDLELQGGLALPKLDAEAALNSRGAVSSATLRGPDGLNARIVPRGETLELEATAAGFPLPIGPDVTLSQFAMKGTATRQGVNISEWGGAIFNGAISGTARMHWGSTWQVDGVVTVRGINAAVFAPALLSQGNADGTGRFSMSGTEPAKLLGTGRLDGRFSISKGTLGSFDLSRAIQSRGKTVSGTTQFSELNGQVSYDRGTVALRNVTIGAGALNAGASADISKGGALTGRIVADVKTAAQTLSATLNLGGTVKEPQVRD